MAIIDKNFINNLIENNKGCKVVEKTRKTQFRTTRKYEVQCNKEKIKKPSISDLDVMFVYNKLKKLKYKAL